MSFKHGLFSWRLVYKSPQTTAEILFNDQVQLGHLNPGYEAPHGLFKEFTLVCLTTKMQIILQF